MIYCKTMAENIFLFAPNIIGYIRIILGLVSFYYIYDDYIASITMYTLSVLLDAVDGHVARYFNQSTKFGAMLDQLTDRCSTMILMSALSHFYPDYSFWFQVSMVIDIACHWIYLHATTLQGRSSHKVVNDNENPILRVYYTNKVVLFSLCVGNEMFFVAMYLKHFLFGSHGFIPILNLTLIVTFPLMIAKAITSVAQAFVASRNLAKIDVADRKVGRKIN